MAIARSKSDVLLEIQEDTEKPAITPSKTFQVTEGSVPSRAGCSGMWRALLFFAVTWVVIGAACLANPWVDCYIDIPERHPQDQVIEEGGHAWIMCGGQRP